MRRPFRPLDADRALKLSEDLRGIGEASLRVHRDGGQKANPPRYNMGHKAQGKVRSPWALQSYQSCSTY